MTPDTILPNAAASEAAGIQGTSMPSTPTSASNGSASTGSAATTNGAAGPATVAQPTPIKRYQPTNVILDDPEDSWEDEDSEDEKEGRVGAEGEADEPGNHTLTAVTNGGGAAASQDEVSSYKAAMREYRQGRKSLLQSSLNHHQRNLSLFASLDDGHLDDNGRHIGLEAAEEGERTRRHRQISEEGDDDHLSTGQSSGASTEVGGGGPTDLTSLGRDHPPSPRKSPMNGLGLLHDEADVIPGVEDRYLPPTSSSQVGSINGYANGHATENGHTHLPSSEGSSKERNSSTVSSLPSPEQHASMRLFERRASKSRIAGQPLSEISPNLGGLTHDATGNSSPSMRPGLLHDQTEPPMTAAVYGSSARRTSIPPSGPKSTSAPTSANAVVPPPAGRSPKFTGAHLGAHTTHRGSADGAALNGVAPAATTNTKFDSSGAQASPTKEAHDLSSTTQTTAAAASPQTEPFSLWDYLREEVLATDFDATQELKWERVTNFMAIPFWMEKIVAFGFMVCLDSFLYTFTIMPLRFFVALATWMANSVRWLVGGEKLFLSSSHKCDMLKALLVVLACYILSITTDASKMYHSVRGQDLVKLYVIFNVLEIADRLCCSFGQDILDTLFSRTTLARRRDGRQPWLRPIAFFSVSLAYIIAHTLVLLYQMVTLNVAINSYDNALLTLLVSNQFVEIKGSVFKKFEKENLFQLTCADIVERFQLTLMLSFIALRNLIELAGAQVEVGGKAASSAASATSTLAGSLSPLPTSFTVLPSFNLLETIFAPVCIVLASECLVDWLKHAFITKFNHIRPAVYGRFMDVLSRDLVIAGPQSSSSSRSYRSASSSKQPTYRHTFVDQSPIVARRLGFAALPLACLLVRVVFQIVGMVGDTSHFDECALPDDAHKSRIGGGGVASQFVSSAARSLGATDEEGTIQVALQFVVQGLAWILTVVVAWAFLVGVKILLGMNLVSYASRRFATMHEREREEQLNARDRPPIGVHKEELAYEAKLAQLIDRSDDNAPRNDAHGQYRQQPNGTPSAQLPSKNSSSKGGTSLLDVNRYTMVKSRIW